MPLGTVDIRKFGGLRLGVDPADVPLDAALVATNVELAADRSFVRTRDGLIRRGAVGAMTGNACNSIELGSGLESLIATTTGARVYIYRADPSSGPTYESDWATTAFSVSMARLGTPTGTYVYIAAGGTGAAVLRRYSIGVGVTSTLGSPYYVGVMPRSNRLAQGGFASAASSPTGANGTGSTVFFSDAGLPETYSANNYVHLRPGDGESIVGMVSWRDQLFVFKQSAVFIFYGESTSSTGTPIFDYRVVDLPGRIPSAGSQSPGPWVGANDDAVFFMTNKGVYRTTGGPPVAISSGIEDEFSTGAFRGTMLGVTDQRVSAQSSTIAYVFDLSNGQWVKWFSVAGALTAPLASTPTASLTSTPEGLWWGIGTTLYYQKHTATTDDGSLVGPVYQSGYSDLGSAAIKTVKRLQVFGTGAVATAVATDYAALGAPLAFPLGTSPTANDGYDVRSNRGIYFSLGFSLGVWQIDGVTLHVRRPRAVGSKL